MTKRRLREFVIDPSSGQYSASRLLLMVIVLIYIPVMGICEAKGVKLGIWAHIAVIVGSVAGVYGVNTAGRVWRRGDEPPMKDEPGAAGDVMRAKAVPSPAKPKGE